MQTRIADRRGKNWPLESRPWTPRGASRRVAEALHAWGYQHFDEETVRTVVELLVTAAVDDGGDHLSVHLADHQEHAMVLVLSSGPHADRPDDGSLLRAVASRGSADCGVENAGDGHRRWALLDLAPPTPAALPRPATPSTER
ncbi:hypothetical protein ACIQM4_25860 [Streptomyces sp. NPDC091272]|uniref:hypothetical protein n=1 Tax=Streptomyces sp. NPDC091272 TaxID=3365981 RepID=UPI0037F71F02